MERAAPSRKERRGPRRSNFFSGVVSRFPGISRITFKGPGEDGEEEESDGIEGVPPPVGASQGIGGPTLAQYIQPVSHQSEPSLLAIMQQMTQIMANIQAASYSDSSKPPECFDGTQHFKVRSFIQSSQLIFQNYAAIFLQDGKKVLYSNSFVIGWAAKRIEAYFSNLTNQDPNYLLNSWKLF
ncbi:hypothetical protein O181_074351 [Austropuccinia psidii MF-1]|uniref:Uncharacterized protein n=1 Tax=Austropuccinia psidii MF-1 TaxID=1389203 RepID=A0A9Q3FCR0_9BASI|nr:hypothetical protein [Austropuccinia psidii MF-1]